MRRKLAWALVGAVTLTAMMFVLGTFGIPSTHLGGSSPYLSPLSDLAVRPAEAFQCNHQYCQWWPYGNYTCEADPLSHCALANPTTCTTYACY